MGIKKKGLVKDWLKEYINRSINQNNKTFKKIIKTMKTSKNTEIWNTTRNTDGWL